MNGHNCMKMACLRDLMIDASASSRGSCLMAIQAEPNKRKTEEKAFSFERQ